MLFRHTLRAVGLSARPLFNNPSIRTATPPFLNAPRNTRLQPARLNSSLTPTETSSVSPTETSISPTTPENAPTSSLPPTLSPPWVVTDLTASEQKAYAEHGPNYLQHLPPAEQQKAQRRAESRKRAAALAEAELGPDWYPIMKIFDKRWLAEYDGPIMAEFARRRALLGPIVDYRKPPVEYRKLREDAAAYHGRRRELRSELRRQVKEEWSREQRVS